jgi:hypothetical protein
MTKFPDTGDQFPDTGDQFPDTGDYAMMNTGI